MHEPLQWLLVVVNALLLSMLVGHVQTPIL